jgi:hypothetical protein
LQDEKEQQQQQATNAFNANNQNDLQQQLLQAQRFPPQQQQQQAQPGFQRNVWQFNGSRYFRWLPSFSLQITNGGHLLPNLRAPLVPDQLNQMVKLIFDKTIFIHKQRFSLFWIYTLKTQQIIQLFPHVPMELIQQDLRRTYSVDLTIENILDDRLNNANNNNNPNNPNANRQNNLLNDEDFSDEDEVVETSTDDEPNNNNNNNNPRANNNAQDVNNSNNDALNGANANQQIGNNNNLRQRNTIFSWVFLINQFFLWLLVLIFFVSKRSFMDTFNSTTSQLARNMTGGENNNAHQRRESTNQNEQETPGQSGGEAGLITKYHTSPSFSENTNNLINRKRELILNSKK